MVASNSKCAEMKTVLDFMCASTYVLLCTNHLGKCTRHFDIYHKNYPINPTDGNESNSLTPHIPAVES